MYAITNPSIVKSIMTEVGKGLMRQMNQEGRIAEDMIGGVTFNQEEHRNTYDDISAHK